jgi:hypothetical protein
MGAGSSAFLHPAEGDGQRRPSLPPGLSAWVGSRAALPPADREHSTELPMNATALINALPSATARPVHPPANGWEAMWARVRMVAAALALAYLAGGVAIPWLLLDAPPLPYVAAAETAQSKAGLGGQRPTPDSAALPLSGVAVGHAVPR